MPTRVRFDVLAYFVAILSVVIAFLTTRATPLSQTPFPLFFAAILVSTWFGGFGPGVLATILSGMACGVVAGPVTSPIDMTLADVVRFAVFASVGMLIVLVTAQMRSAEAQVRQEREQLRVTLASIGDAVLVTDAHGQIQSLNQVAEMLTGWNMSEAKGRPLDQVFRIVHEATGLAAPNPVTIALQEGKIVGLANHTMLISRDGTKRPIDDSAAPIRTEGGSIVGAVLVFRDVTERRRQEETLRLSEERHRLISELTSDYTSTSRVTEDGNLIPEATSEGFTKVTGYSLAELDGIGGWPVLIEPEDMAIIQASIERLLSGETDTSELRIRTKGGERRWVRYLGRPVWDASGRVVRIISAAQDITQQKRHEQAQIEQVRLAAFGRDVGLILAGAASLSETLQQCTDAIVRHLGGSFARIWTLDDTENVLRLQASAGLYTHKDGPHSRIPVGQYKIGLIAQSRQPHLTNAVVGDPRVPDQEWARREGMVAFAGYPLVVDDSLVGVMAMFARHSLSDRTLEAMASVAHGIAVGIERKRALERLHEERERLAVTLASIGDAVITTDATGKVRFLNPVAEELTGWQQEQARGVELDRVFHIVNEESRQLVESPVAKVLRDGCIVGLANHTVLIDKSGRERPIDDSAAPIQSERGNIQGVVLVFRDVTERRQAEKRLHEAHARTTAILESIADSFVHFDRDWRFTYINRQAVTILQRLQRQPAGLLGMQLWQAFPELVGSNAYHQYHRAVRDQVPVQFLEYFAPLDSWYEVRAYPSKDGLSVYSQDVTERRRSEEAVREQRNWLLTTLTSIGDAVIATDRNERVMLLNPVAERLTGWKQEQAQGRSLSEVFTIVNETSRQRVENPVAKVLREGQVVGLANHTALISRDGTEWPIDDSAAPIKNDQGEIQGVVLVFREIREQKLRERRRSARLAVTEILAESASTAEAVPRILNAVADNLDWHAGVFWTVEPAAKLLHCQHIWCHPTIQFERFDASTRQQTFESGVGLPGRVYHDNRPIWIPDVVRDADFVRSTAADHEGLHAAVALPVSVGAEVLGVIEFFSQEIKEPDDDLLELFATLGNQIGLFIHRRQAAQAMRESEERLRLALEAGCMGTWDWDIRTNAVQWSENFEQIHGLVPGAFDGTLAGFERLIHPDDREHVQLSIRHALENRSDYECEFRNIWSDGTMHWMLGKGRSYFDENGQPIRMIGIGMNITERKQSEHRLRQAEERYRNLVNGLDAIVWEADAASLQFSFVSERAEQILGYPVERWLSEPNAWLNFIHPEDRENAAVLFRSALAAEKDHALDYRAIRADGQAVWLHDIVYLVRDSQGRVEKLRGLMVDITDRKRLEGELRERMEQLAESDRRKDEFLATLAHELRNPLAPIRNSLHILKHASPDGPTAERVRQMMERQVQHMTRLVDDLLDVSRISQGKIKLRRETVNIAALVRRTLETLQQVTQERQHQLTISVPEEPLMIDADPTRLEQILHNVLNNAVKYTDPGGHIWVTVRLDGDKVVVAVRDSGVGIEREMLPRIFDLFVQAERRLDDAHGGLGIGLTLVKRLVELHGGSIQASSDGPGHGSEFTVRLPVSSSPQPSQPSAELAPNQPATLFMKRKILVVDDNFDAAESLALLLRLQEHDVQVAHDGPAALAIVQTQAPEVVLLDIGLPGLDGFEVAERIRKQLGLTQVALIALTGWGQEEDHRRSREAGFDYHLVKPVEPEALAQLLNQVRR